MKVVYNVWPKKASPIYCSDVYKRQVWRQPADPPTGGGVYSPLYLPVRSGTAVSYTHLGPLTEPMFYVLMSFLRRDMCGTEITEFVERRTRGRVRLGPGTLYRCV